MTPDQTRWITTGDALRILGFALSPHTFRDKFRGIIHHARTPGGHYRWCKEDVEEQARLMGLKRAS